MINESGFKRGGNEGMRKKTWKEIWERERRNRGSKREGNEGEKEKEGTKSEIESGKGYGRESEN